MSEHEPGTLPRLDLDEDVIAAGALPAPASELPRQHGAQVRFDPGAGGFRVVTDGEGRCAPDIWAAGDVTGYQGPQAAAGRVLRLAPRWRRRSGRGSRWVA